MKSNLETNSNSGQRNTPRLIGEMDELSTAFDLNGQEVFESCGVTHENNHFIFGGEENRRQVLKLIDCSLSNIGSIPFDHRLGACDTSNGIIILCFDYDDNKQCRQATTPLGEWNDMALSTYYHRLTQIATSTGNLVN